MTLNNVVGGFITTLIVYDEAFSDKRSLGEKFADAIEEMKAP